MCSIGKGTMEQIWGSQSMNYRNYIELLVFKQACMNIIWTVGLGNNSHWENNSKTYSIKLACSIAVQFGDW